MDGRRERAMEDKICDLQMNLKMSRDCTAELRDENETLRAQVSALQIEADEAKRRCAIAETVLKNGAEGLWELADYRADNLSLNEGLRESAAARRKLEARLAEAERHAKHWKDQHANEVKRAKTLKDTGDIPLQRIQAYERMGELQGQVDKMKEKIDSDNAIMSALQRGGRAFVELPEYWRGVESERDQLRAEVERLKSKCKDGLHTEECQKTAATEEVWGGCPAKRDL